MPAGRLAWRPWPCSPILPPSKNNSYEVHGQITCDVPARSGGHRGIAPIRGVRQRRGDGEARPGTRSGAETELSFACDVTDITASSARIIVSPTDGYTGYYYFDVMEKTEFETQYADNLQVLADRFEAMVQETADRYIEAGQVSSIEELMESAIASQGIADYEYQTLNPLTDYCVWACGVDLQGKVTSDISVIKEFTTLGHDVRHRLRSRHLPAHAVG